MIQYLKENDLYDNTLIVCMSDHGDMMGAHGMMMKSVEPFEEIYHIPLLMKLPKQMYAARWCWDAQCGGLWTEDEIAAERVAAERLGADAGARIAAERLEPDAGTWLAAVRAELDAGARLAAELGAAGTARENPGAWTGFPRALCRICRNWRL